MTEKVATETPVMKVRSNPWMISTLVLGVLLIGFVAFSLSNGNVTGNVVSTSSIGQNVIDSLNQQTGGGVTLASGTAVTKESGVYKIMVSYQGQTVPIYSTLDGKLVGSLSPVDGSATGSTGTTATTGSAITIDPAQLVNAPMEGNKDAKVTIVEFSDFQCPFCERFYSATYAQLKKDYIDTGKVKLYFKDFPLSFHPNAPKAAEAAHCASDQGKFWEMHNKLFDNNALLNSASTADAIIAYKKWAKELNLKSEDFDSCLDSGKYTQIVADSETYGQSLGVSGTPSFFINGKSLVGAQPYSAFKQVIDAELAATA